MPEPAGLRERKAAYDARTAQYLRLGLDRFAAADFVATAAGRPTMTPRHTARVSASVCGNTKRSSGI
jgi:hypothetical protein